jgi:hypothetical protein
VLALDVGHPMLQIFNGPLQKNSNEARAGFFLSLAPKINWASMLAKIHRSQNKRSKNNLGETTWAAWYAPVELYRTARIRDEKLASSE